MTQLEISKISRADAFVFTPHNQLIVASGSEIQIYDAACKLVDKFAHEHGSKVNCMDVCGDVLVTGSDDHSVKQWSIASKEFVKTLSRSALPIRIVSIRPPSARMVAVVADDQDVKLIKTQDIENTSIIHGHKKAITAVSMDPAGDFMVTVGLDGQIIIWDLVEEPNLPVKTFDDLIEKNSSFFNVSWNLKRDQLAFPGKSQEIIVMERESWDILFKIKNDKLSDIKSVAWSRDGNYLAAIDTKEQLFIWNLMVNRHSPAFRIKCPSAMKTLQFDQNSKVYTIDVSGQVYSFAIPSLKKTSLVQEEAQLDIEMSSEEEDMNDFIVDDDGAGYAAELLNEQQFEQYEERQRKAVSTSKKRIERDYSAEFEELETQKAFQPGSTPLRNSRRYLSFNMLGLVSTIDQSTHFKVSVEFHDKSTRPFSFTDNYGYSMGCLGEQGALFASESTSSAVSTIYYRPFDGSGDWMAQFDSIETAQLVALSENYAIIATDQRNLRFFSLNGLQKLVISVPGPLVSMAANQNKLMVVYHKGGTFNGEQNLGMSIYDLDQMVILKNECRVSITAGSTLQWINVTDSGLVVTFDSCGILRCLVNSCWYPLLDSRKHRGLKNWPIGLADNNLMCVICKGGDKYPPFPKPLLDEIPLQAPFLNLDNQQGQLEEKLFRHLLFADQDLKFQAESDKLTLQLIQLSCKSEKTSRALELATSLHLVKSLDGAIKLAVYYKLAALAEKINLIKQDRYQATASAVATSTNESTVDTANAVSRSRATSESATATANAVAAAASSSTSPVHKLKAEPKILAKPANPFAISTQKAIPLETRADMNLIEAIQQSSLVKTVKEEPAKKRTNQFGLERFGFQTSEKAFLN